MDIISILNNNWFVSIVSIFLGILIVPIINSIRSLFGHFSGKYLAITFQPDGETILIELVKCRHVGDKAYGKIDGVCFARRYKNMLISSGLNVGKYKFDGFIDERLFILSYSTTKRSVKSSGTLTLQGDASGTIFEGVWGGFAEDRVISTKCVWFRSRGNIPPAKDTESILKLAYQALDEYGELPDSPEEVEELLEKMLGNNEGEPFSGTNRELKVLRYLWETRKRSPDLFIQGKGGLGKTVVTKLSRNKQHNQVENATDLHPTTPQTTKRKSKKSK